MANPQRLQLLLWDLQNRWIISIKKSVVLGKSSKGSGGTQHGADRWALVVAKFLSKIGQILKGNAAHRIFLIRCKLRDLSRQLSLSFQSCEGFAIEILKLLATKTTWIQRPWAIQQQSSQKPCYNQVARTAFPNISNSLQQLAQLREKVRKSMHFNTQIHSNFSNKAHNNIPFSWLTVAQALAQPPKRTSLLQCHISHGLKRAT